MTNRAQELIKSFYEEEAMRKESEITYSDFAVRLNSSDIAMLEVIAKRFGKAADRIASEAVSAAIYSMVEALETSERKNMTKEADELNESLAKKAAKSNGNPDFDEKSVTWVMNDRAITREENKRKKEQEEKEKETNVETTQQPEASSETKATASEQEDTTPAYEGNNTPSESNSVFAS
jgi:hypothetical protein